jgi:hypothetical protein
MWIAGTALAYLLFRGAVALLPSYQFDVQMYAHWSLKAAQEGLSGVYRTSGMDYPPLYAYVLYPLGKLYTWASPGGSRLITESRLLTFLIKSPPILFDLGTAWLLAEIARRRGASIAWRKILPALYLLNPAVLFATGYWGHPDSMYTFFVLAAMAVLGGDRFGRPHPRDAGERSAPDPLRRVLWSGSPALAGALLALALLTKPLAAPYVPLLIGLSFLWHGTRRTMLGIAAGLATVVVFCLPFTQREGAAVFIRHMTDNIGVMPFTTCNAHNIWWLLAPWHPAGAPWLGPFTPALVGIGLVLLFLGALAGRARLVHRTQRDGLTAEQGIALAAAVGFGFFMLSTHMHENHMFPVIALTLALLPWPASAARTARAGSAIGAFLAAASLGILLNMALHDPNLEAWWPPTSTELTPLEVEVGGRLYMGPPAATRMAALLNLGTFLAFATWIFLPRGRGLLGRLAPADPRSTR